MLARLITGNHLICGKNEKKEEQSKKEDEEEKADWGKQIQVIFGFLEGSYKVGQL